LGLVPALVNLKPPGSYSSGTTLLAILLRSQCGLIHGKRTRAESNSLMPDK
jgi:hypothetical protein